MKEGTAHVSCSCQHEFQDKTYGVGVRVANTTQKQPSTNSVEVRCTVCKKLHVVDQSKVK